jgi:CTD small phosphatase-like protein 2
LVLKQQQRHHGRAVVTAAAAVASRRVLSSWTAPSNTNNTITKRSRNFASSSVAPQHYHHNQQQNQQQMKYQRTGRRPVINGKSVAFHVNDLKNMTTAKQQQQRPPSFVASSSSSQSSTSSSSSPLQKNSLIGRTKVEYTPIREYESDLIVVLDMDECLIHSQFLQMNSPGAKYAHQVKRANSNGSNGGLNKQQDVVDTFNITLPDGELVRVHERPFLHDFLHEVSQKYETHIFTAAMEVYARPVLQRLDPHGKIFTKAWYRESCELDASVGAYVKNLSFAWGDDQLKRTVLVDNNPLSFLANPENGILVSSFYDDARDTTLPAVLDLLHELDQEEDVRPTLDARFRLRHALNELSSGRPFAGRDQQLDNSNASSTSKNSSCRSSAKANIILQHLDDEPQQLAVAAS